MMSRAPIRRSAFFVGDQLVIDSGKDQDQLASKTSRLLIDFLTVSTCKPAPIPLKTAGDMGDASALNIC